MSEPHHSTSPQELAILCVDDEQVILKSLTDQLKTHFGRAYLYETALNGEEALEVLDDLVDEGVKTLLVISDWLMPGMKGDELIIEVHKRFPRTAKVILTGQAEDIALERARIEGGLNACLRKPWSRAQLLEIVEGALSELDATAQGGER